VLGVFVLGALLAQAIGQPVVRDLFHVQNWSSNDTLLGFLAAILIVGVVQEFLKYAAVRYTVFGSAEFDQPVDGIIYGASAGLGYATMLNIWYVIQNGGVDLGVGAVRCAVEALAQASTAGVVGYFLGQAKFRAMGPLWLPAGIVLAAVLNATVNLLLDRAPLLGTFGFNVWAALIAAVVVAGVIFGVLLSIIKRLNERTVSHATQADV
jgi:RsiW-degrading membrane proteinase PrsW (M82 family)